MRGIRRAVAALAVTGVLLVAGVPAGAQGGDTVAPVPVDPLVEAGWILFAQTIDGAIATHPDRTYVDPYLGALAAEGLATTGDPRHAEQAWRFVEWYAASMDADGYVHDYTVRGDHLQPVAEADSTDAYAAVFVLAAAAAYDAAPDRARLDAIAPALRRAVAAIRSTLRLDGLTGSKPSFMVAYLMDQAEVFAGLRAAIRLGREVDDQELVREAQAVARPVRRAVRDLWNPSTRSFDWAVHPDGTRDVTNWAQLYPDALSQVWAVRYGLVGGERGRALLRQFLITHPDAHDPSSIALVDGTLAPGGYWPGVGAVLAAVDPAAPERYLAGTTQAAHGSGRAWPYNVRAAADVLGLVAARP